MPVNAHEILSGIRTVIDMAKAFRDEGHCRSLLEALVWPNGRICPCCGYRKSIALAGRDLGKRSRPGLYQCSNGDCRHQFTVTTQTPLHSTKLPLQTWLTGLWLILQSDKGISSIRLGEALGISQQAAWRMGHALRLLVAQNDQFAGTIEIDQFYFGTTPRLDADRPRLGRGRKGQPNTLKTPALAVVQRPEVLTAGSPAGKAHAAVINNLSEAETDRVLSNTVDQNSHLMSDAWQGFISIGTAFSAHDTVNHSQREYARGPVHTNSAEGYNDRVRRTISGVFHHISPPHANLYFNEISFRWSQRVITTQARRRTRKGHETVRTLWSRIPPALQLIAVFRRAVGKQIRRTPEGSIHVKSAIAVFG